MQSCFLSSSLCMLCIAVLYHSVVIICFMLCIYECLVSRVTMQSIISGLLYQCNVVCLCVCLFTLLVIPVVWHSQTDPVSVRVGSANGVELFSLKVWYICWSFPLRGDWFLLLPAVVVVIVLNTDCWCLRLILYIMLAVPWQFFHFFIYPSSYGLWGINNIFLALLLSISLIYMQYCLQLAILLVTNTSWLSWTCLAMFTDCTQKPSCYIADAGT